MRGTDFTQPVRHVSHVGRVTGIHLVLGGSARTIYYGTNAPFTQKAGCGAAFASLPKRVRPVSGRTLSRHSRAIKTRGVDWAISGKEPKGLLLTLIQLILPPHLNMEKT